MYVLSTTNLNLSDGIHNSAQANVVLGEKLASQCYHVLDGGAEYAAPALEVVEAVTGKERKALGLAEEGFWLKLTFTCFIPIWERTAVLPWKMARGKWKS